MPNARPAFMEKCRLTTNAGDDAASTDTWRFYPKHGADTWEFIVSANDTIIEWNGVSHEWTGEPTRLSAGTRTVTEVNAPSAVMLTSLDTSTSVPTDTTGHFVLDFGSFKAIQVAIKNGSGGSKVAAIQCKAYDKNTGTSGGNGFISGTAHKNS
tara:strand:+ start:24307 stop:24768 length:462 start_codon:yes stop_codon:yes gene_type:complete